MYFRERAIFCVTEREQSQPINSLELLAQLYNNNISLELISLPISRTQRMDPWFDSINPINILGKKTNAHTWATCITNPRLPILSCLWIACGSGKQSLYFRAVLSRVMPPSSSCLCSCVCKPGYEGDGLSCSKVDPCATLNPGGCSSNVSMCFSHRKVSREEGLARNFCGRVRVFTGVPGFFSRHHYSLTSLMAKARCPPKALNGCPLSASPPGWVCSDRPRGAQVCLPGRMDRRWKGLLSHQQLPAAHHGTVPPECHLHIRWASSGRSLHSMSLLVHVLNHFGLPELGLPTLFSSPKSSLPHSHDIISTWCSLPKTVSLNSSPSAPSFLRGLLWQQTHF